MKFTKILAIVMALTMLLAFTVACDSGSSEGETSAAVSDSGSETSVPFVTTITVIALDEEGEEVKILDEVEAIYNGLTPTDSLTIFEILSDYCFDNGHEYVADETTGRLSSIDGYSTAEGGFVWKYEVNENELLEYDIFIANGSEIVIRMEEVVK